MEVQGGTWSRGAHVRGKGYENDREKSFQAQMKDWIAIEVTSSQITKGIALKWIQEAFEKRHIEDGALLSEF